MNRTPPPRGFTLVEVVLVAVILVLIGTMVVPRMAGTARSEFAVAVEGVASCLSTFAFQEATDERLVALSFSGTDRQLIVLQLRGDKFAAEWRTAPMAPSVSLPDHISFSLVSVDGASMNPQDWFLSTQPSGGRPDIRLRLESDRGPSAEIALPSHALGPVVRRDGDPNAPMIREPADLDEMGADREAW